MNTLRSLTMLASAAVLAAAFAAPATAASPDAFVKKVRVPYGDLNLAHPAGAEKLYARLRHAADVVCGRVETRDLASRHEVARCREQAIATAVADVRSPAFSARYAAKTGRVGPNDALVAKR